MRVKFLVLVKLLEVIARGLFVVFCTYALPLIDAGHFGVLVASVGAAVFLIGFERFVDIQRRMSGAEPHRIQAEFRAVLRFFLQQYVIITAVAVMLASLFTTWSWPTLAALAAVLAAEHLGNQTYLATLIYSRGYLYLVAAMVKNFCLLVAVVFIFVSDRADFTVDAVVNAWGLVSTGFIAMLAILWHYQSRSFPALNGSSESWKRIGEQYRSSCAHFLTGAIAFVAVQADRFVVSGALPELDIGIYFRNLTITAFMLQFISIVSYMRLAPRVMELMRDGHLDRAFNILRRECALVLAGVAALVGLGLLVDKVLGHPGAAMHIDPHLLLILTVGMLFRILGDYCGLLLLSMKYDRKVLMSQVVSVLVGLPLLWCGAEFLGLQGAVIGALAMPFCLMLLNGWKCWSSLRVV